MSPRAAQWQVVPISQLYEGLYDGPHATPKPADSGPVFLGIKNVTEDGHLDLTAVRHIAEEDFGTWTRRVEPRPGDLVFTYEATLNRYAIIPAGFRGCLGRRMALIRTNPERVDVRYLYYYFFSKPWRDVVQKHTLAGATVDRLPLTRFPDFPVQVPPLPEQRRIAGILSAYDDLIENCERRIRVLDEMARALYREWFVHFRYPGHENTPLVDSPLGRIPKGWHPAPLARVAAITMGHSPKSEFYNETGDGLPFHQGVTDFGARFPEDRVFCTAEARLGEAGDILFSVRAPVGRMNIAPHRIALGRGLSALRHHDGHQVFLWEQLRARFTRKDMIGNGAIFAAVTKKEMETIETVAPPPALVDSFENLVAPIHDDIAALDTSSRNLRATRDLLLPRLLSGQLSVDVSA